jgi:exodeoxyribonuclease-5
VVHYDKHEFYTAFDTLDFQADKVVISFRNKTTLRHDEILQGRAKGTLFQDGDLVRSRDSMKLSPAAAESLGRGAGDIIIRTAEIFRVTNVEYDEENRWYKATHAEKGYVFYIPEFPELFDKDVNRTLQLCKSGERAWRDYYALKEAYCRVFHSQFITCHSAQGSSFETVFVDLRDMKYARTEDDVARLVYTGVSRASKMVHVLV